MKKSIPVRIFGRLVDIYRRRRAINDLLNLSNHLLHDIGIDRHEVPDFGLDRRTTDNRRCL